MFNQPKLFFNELKVDLCKSCVSFFLVKAVRSLEEGIDCFCVLTGLWKKTKKLSHGKKLMPPRLELGISAC